MPVTVKEKWLRVLLTGGALLFALLYPALPCAAQTFERLSTDRFLFLFHEDDRKSAMFLAHNADRIAAGISDTLGFPLTQQVEVVLVPTLEDFKKAYPAEAPMPRWAVGAAYPEKNRIVLLLGTRSDLGKTFCHELHHILLGKAFNGKERVPRWLDEGLAMLQADEWSLSRLSTMTTAVLKGSLIPMDRLVVSFPAELWNAELAYCQSFYFISFLKGKFGDDAFRRFFRQYSMHKDFHAAIRSVYRCSWEAMEQQWLDYLKLRFSWIPLITSTSTLWFGATLLFLAGYLRKKRKSRQRLQQWEQEEMLLPGDDEKRKH